MTTSADSGPGSLRNAIETASSGDRIIFDSNLAGGNTITLSSPLLIIDKNLQIDGSANANLVIDGNNQHRAFFVGSHSTSVNVSISSLTINNVTAQGGHGAGVPGTTSGVGGGGGGLGAGAAVFVDSGATVTVSAINVQNSAAIGGNGGNHSGVLGGAGGGGGLGGNGGQGGGGQSGVGHHAGSGGGGGGLGGRGGNGHIGGGVTGGGGGGGLSGAGGDAPSGNGSGIASGGAGGAGGGGSTNGGTGTDGAGNGGLGSAGTGAGGGGGGGFGGQDGYDYNAPGNGGSGGNGGYGGGGGGEAGFGGVNRPGDGGDFGGGGGGSSNGGQHGGNGGYGGGGGGAGIALLDPGNGGDGGFGGGGGASLAGGSAGIGGAYGGNGGAGGGGGGGALGGAIFVREGGNLIVQDSSFTGGSVTAGAGAGAGSSGQALGSSIFLHNVDLGIDVTGTQTATISDDIADNSGAAGGAASTLTKTGTGTLILQGNNTYAGNTIVQNGTLDLQGTVAGNTLLSGGHLKNNGTIAGNTNVGGGTLSGSGLVQGNVDAFGTVAPGNSIGTLNVGANYNSHGGSVLEIEIEAGGTTPGVHNDWVRMGGQAVLNGGTVSVLAAPGNYQQGTTYTFLTATGGVQGTFDGIVDNLAFLDAVLVYDPLAVGFVLARNNFTFADIGQTPNQRALGRYLDEIAPTATGPLADLLFEYRLGTDADVLAALTQYQGQIYATLPVSQLQQTSQNLALLRNELALALECEDYGEFGWIRGYGMGGSVSSTHNASGYDAGIGGTELAYQRCVDDGTSLGAFGNFGWSTIGLREVNERADVDSYQAGITFQRVYEIGYVLGIVGAGVQDNDVRRSIDTLGMSGEAASSFSSWQQFNYLEVGSRIGLGNTELRPYVAGQYIFL